MPSYDEAVQALYRVPVEDFVAERKRLGGELKATDPGAAKLFAKLPRPSVSAWATNQLWWRERDAFEELFETSDRLRAGDLEATGAHRKVTNRLVLLASEILREAGHGASEATLRRVAANLGALAAAGNFDPDLPGALRSDRDPPGFGALAGASFPERPVAATREEAPRASPPAPASDAAERARAQAEKRRLAEEQARLRTERKNTEGALRAATAVIEKRDRDREKLAQELAEVETELAQARAQVERLEARLRDLDSAEASIKVTATDA